MEEENKFRVITSKWSDELEKTSKQIGESCVGYKWMNIFAARKNERYYNFLMYFSIALGPIAGILSAIGGSNYEITQVFVTIFSFFNGVVSAIIKFSEFGEKSINYKTTASKYASLESNIRRQLSLAREERVNAGEYLEWITSSFDELFNSSPLISNTIYEEWVVFAKQNGLTIPKDLGSTVTVNNTEKVAQLCSTSINVNKNVSKSDNSSENGSVVVEIEKVKKERTILEGEMDLSKYSDGKMKYEMSRLFRMGVK